MDISGDGWLFLSLSADLVFKGQLVALGVSRGAVLGMGVCVDTLHVARRDERFGFGFRLISSGWMASRSDDVVVVA